jgi:hypothetical protein
MMIANSSVAVLPMLAMLTEDRALTPLADQRSTRLKDRASINEDDQMPTDREGRTPIEMDYQTQTDRERKEGRTLTILEGRMLTQTDREGQT